jgi:hypothetical protein
MRRTKKYDREKEVLIYMHIPKAAGSTFNEILQKEYGARFKRTDDYDTLNDWKRLRVSYDSPGYPLCVTGHFWYGVHEYIPMKSTYITMFRDPVERIMSKYYYIRRSPDNHLYNEVVGKNLSLEEYVKADLDIPLDVRNGLIRYLLDYNEYFSKEYTVTRADLNKVIERLDNNFSFFGLAEEFDASLAILKKIFDWGDQNLRYELKNVTENRPKKSEISPRVISIIENQISYDLELYDYVKKRFQDFKSSLDKRHFFFSKFIF